MRVDQLILGKTESCGGFYFASANNNEEYIAAPLFSQRFNVMMEHGSERQEMESDSGTMAITAVQENIAEPKMYRVLLHNDDYTPMEFVVAILENYFNKSEPQATQIMLDVHKKGVGICGVFTKEIAETKTVMVAEKAKMHRYPLRCTHEEEAN